MSEKMQNLSNPFAQKYSKYTAAMRTASALTHGKGESITYKEIRDRLYNDLNKCDSGIRNLSDGLCGKRGM